MDRETTELLDKAQESLDAARLLRQGDYHDFAASRAYYGMFYAAEAALLALGLTFSKHSAVVAAFGRYLANQELVPRHLHRYLLDAFDLRTVGDYDAPGSIGDERASQAINWADEFIEEISQFLKAKEQAEKQ